MSNTREGQPAAAVDFKTRTRFKSADPATGMVRFAFTPDQLALIQYVENESVF